MWLEGEYLAHTQLDMCAHMHSHALTFTVIHFLVTALMIYFLFLCFSFPSFSPSLLPQPLPSVLTRRWCRPVRNTHLFWHMADSGRRKEQETVRDWHTRTKRRRQPAIWGRSPAVLQLCWSQRTVLRFVRTSENQCEIRGLFLHHIAQGISLCWGNVKASLASD